MAENGEPCSGRRHIFCVMLDPTLCHRALAARDARYDGRFFVGVTSTRIYCRPICPARTPRADRCRFHRSPAEAEAAGFRPCLRCRPELAPGAASVDAPSKLARRAAARIAAGAADAAGLTALAAELGVSDRHLRRVCEEELGVPPIALAQTHRLLAAKRLLTDSTLPVTQVAYASGFRSLRRFNALFLARYRLSPSALRRTAAAAPQSAAMRLVLSYRAPLDWAGLLAHLAPRAMAGIERVDGDCYRSTVRAGASDLLVTMRPLPNRAALECLIDGADVPAVLPLLARIKRLADTDAECSCIEADLRAAGLGAFGPLQPGRRVPGTLDTFQAALRIVLGQQVTVRGATTLAARLVAQCAERSTASAALAAGLTHRPLTPARVADAGLPRLRACGLTEARARAVQALATGVADGTVPLEPDGDLEAARMALVALPGIGAWTAAMIGMRVLRDPDAWPAGDLVLRQRLGGVSARAADAMAEAWRPWRAYAAVQLWAMAPSKSAARAGST